MTESSDTTPTRNERIARNGGSLPTVLVIVGSLRTGSYNRQLAEYAVSTLRGKANVGVLDWKDVPIFNQDDEYPAPRAVRDARRQVADADALWIFTPEYNYGVPGPLKNLIDWLSRPLQDGTPAVIFGKNVTVSGVGGVNCVRDGFAALLTSLKFLRMVVAPVTFTGVALMHDDFASSTLHLDDATKAAVAHQGDALLENVARNIVVE